MKCLAIISSLLFLSLSVFAAERNAAQELGFANKTMKCSALKEQNYKFQGEESQEVTGFIARIDAKGNVRGTFILKSQPQDIPKEKNVSHAMKVYFAGLSGWSEAGGFYASSWKDEARSFDDDYYSEINSPEDFIELVQNKTSGIYLGYMYADGRTVKLACNKFAK